MVVENKEIFLKNKRTPFNVEDENVLIKLIMYLVTTF